MPLINLQYITNFTLIILLISMLSACSSPVKYQAREHYSQSKTSQVKSTACRSPYIVRSGDTLSGIASHCDIKMGELAKLNHLLPPYIIYVRQELVLPMNQEHVDTKKTATVKRPKMIAEQKQLNHRSLSLKESQKTTNVPKKSIIKPRQEVKEVSARALKRPQSHSSKVKAKSSKNKAWQWPMHKGLSYRYLRDNAGLSILEIYGVPGQKVKAVAPGKVVYAGNGIINYGWMLVIKHENDYMSIYAHNSALLVKEGDVVNAGESVATMGATGSTKRPKLYVEARYQGRKIDIKKVLKQ